MTASSWSPRLIVLARFLKRERSNSPHPGSPKAELQLILCLLLLATAATAGCSDDGMVSIAGTVTFDGSPLAQGTISFFPADNQGASAEAVISDGSYSVSMPRGKKNVIIRGYEKVGERYPWGKDNPPADILKEIVPKEFNDESSLTMDTDNNRSDVNFALTAASNQ